MRIRFLVVSFTLVFLLLAGTAFSQTTVTGLFDGNYVFNFNNPVDFSVNDRAFDIHSQTFSLNYAELSLEQKAKPVGFRIDIGFGDAMQVVANSAPTAQERTNFQYIQQAYVTLNKKNLTVDFGKFVTPLGAEVIETKDNWNYSRGLLFTYAVPFYHYGVRATYAPNDKVSIAGYVVNGWNNVIDTNRGKSIIVATTFKPTGSLTLNENYMMGAESSLPADKRRHDFDSILEYDLNKVLSGQVNYDYSFDGLAGVKRKWDGIAFYGKISPNAKDTGFKIVPRYEWYDDKNAATTGIAQKLNEGTVTLQWVSKDAGTFWTEYRRDWSDHHTFEKYVQSAPGQTKLVEHQDTLEFGYTYSFSKEIK